MQVIDYMLFLACAICLYGCNSPATSVKKLEPVYDRKTGRLAELKFDSNGDGRFDTFSYMDGVTLLRTEIDQNEDGKIDRWEYYGPDRKIQKVGFSRSGDGVEDAWQYADASGAVVRLELSSKRDKKVDRIEYYEKGTLVRAEEDTDRDGKIDKWETYDAERLTSVAFDETHRGTPDRRLIYGADGTVRVEVDPTGDGRFVEQAAPPPGSAARRDRHIAKQ